MYSPAWFLTSAKNKKVRKLRILSFQDYILPYFKTIHLRNISTHGSDRNEIWRHVSR